MKKVLLLEPFFTGSHQSWAEGFQRFSQLEIKILSLPGRHWKWRMHNGAVSLAKQFMDMDFQPDLILATDMLDLTTFLGLTRKKTVAIPIVLYFHENQITYPWSATDSDVELKRDNQYGFINYTSALATDAVFFNSQYHKTSFLNALPDFLNQFPDYIALDNIEKIAKKSEVLYLGVDLERFIDYKIEEKNEIPLLVWNHRWEYDKNPITFFETLFQLKKEGIPFKIAVLGKRYKNAPAIFEKAEKILAEEMVHFGIAKQFSDYATWLWKADFIPITSNQDFFGQSVVEALYCNCFPILPKRLAFPEHIPKMLHDRFYYETDKAFYELLKQNLVNYNPLKKESFQSYVKRYDWCTLAPIYEKKLLEVIISCY